MLIFATLDDLSGVIVPHAIDRLMEKGAYSVHVSQTVTKKGRVGLLFIIDVSENNQESIGESIMAELGTLGYHVVETQHIHSVNMFAYHRLIIKSETRECIFKIKIKNSSSTNGTHIKSEPELVDLSSVIEDVKRELDVILPLKRLITEIKKNLDEGNDSTILNVD